MSLLARRDRVNVIVVGNLTVDEIYVNGEFVKTSIGGGAYYGSMALRALGLKPVVLSNIAIVQKKIVEKEGLRSIYGLYTNSPPIFRLNYVGAERVLQLLSPGTRIPDTLFPCDRYDLVLINPVYHDITLSLMKKAGNTSAYVALDVQGLVRKVGESGSRVELAYNEDAWEYIEFADIIHADYNEATALTGASTINEAIEIILSKHGKDKIWLLTYGGEKPIVVITSKTMHLIDPPKINNVVDETGAGDTFLAAFTIYYIITHDLIYSIRKSLELTSLKLRGKLLGTRI